MPAHYSPHLSAAHHSAAHHSASHHSAAHHSAPQPSHGLILRHAPAADSVPRSIREGYPFVRGSAGVNPSDDAILRASALCGFPMSAGL